MDRELTIQSQLASDHPITFKEAYAVDNMIVLFYTDIDSEANQTKATVVFLRSENLLS